MMTEAVASCKVCDQGTLESRKKHRMSGPAVVIGYLFLVPSIIGMLIGFVMLVGTGKATVNVAESLDVQVREELQKAEVPAAIVEKVIERATIPEVEIARLPDEQKTAVESAQMTLTAGTVGAGLGAAVGAGVSIFLIIVSFVGGLIGWLLVMKKKVLQCTNCGAVVSAS